MLKYLAILVLVLGCAFIVARHDEYTALESTQKSIVKSNPALTAESNENHPQKNPKNSAWDSPSGHIFHNAFRWPEGTTVWAILLTLMAIAEQTLQTRRIAEAALRQTGVMAGQLEEMKRQAGWMEMQTGRMSRQADLMNRQNIFARESLAAARDSADAAKANADAALAQISALKSKERAKLSFELDPFVPGLYFRSSPWMQTLNWRVKLHGQSEAFEVQSPVILCIGEPTTHLSAGFSTLTLPGILTPAQREYSGKIVLNFHDSSGEPLGEDTREKLENGKDKLFCAGFIEYTDVYGDRWILPIRRRWVYHEHHSPLIEKLSNSPGGFWYEEGDNREKKKES